MSWRGLILIHLFWANLNKESLSTCLESHVDDVRDMRHPNAKGIPLLKNYHRCYHHNLQLLYLETDILAGVEQEQLYFILL